MMQPSKEVRVLTLSIFLYKIVKTRALIIFSLVFFTIGPASAATLISGSLDGTLTFKLVYPDNQMTLRGSDGEVGAVEVDFHDGEGSRTLANVRNINIIAWGPEKLININGVTIEGNLKIVTGFERDRINLQSNSIRGKLKIVSGDGNDYININTNFVGGSTEIFAGAGHDYFPIKHNYFSDTVRLLSGAGVDTVILYDSVIQNNANIKMGSGNDVVLSYHVNTNGNARIFTGEGDDYVKVLNGEFSRNLTLYTGADNDTLKMQRNVVSGRVILGGAAGMADVYEYDGRNQFFMSSEITGFETYSPIGM